MENQENNITQEKKVVDPKKQKRRKLGTIIGCSAIGFSIVVSLVVGFVINPYVKYSKGCRQYREGEYYTAAQTFSSLGSFKDSQQKYNLCMTRSNLENNKINSVISYGLKANLNIKANYDAGYGTCEKTSETIKTKTLQKATREHYDFKTWDIKSYKFSNNDQDLSLRLQAVYEGKKVQVTFSTYEIIHDIFDKDYSSGERHSGRLIDKIYFVRYGEEYSFYTPEKEGYTYEKCTVDFAGDLNSDFPLSGTWTYVDKNGDYDCTIHAEFHQNSYKATLDANGGTFAGGETTYEKSVTYDNVYKFPTPTRDGYSFVEWHLPDGTKPKTGPWKIANDCYLTAIWEVK